MPRSNGCATARPRPFSRLLASGAPAILRAGVLSLALVPSGCAPPAGTGEANDPAAGYVITADSAQLAYVLVGSGADTVVVVHGFQGFGASYLRQDLQPLAKKRVLVFFDQRGDGASSPASDPAQLGLSSRVQDLEALRQHFNFARVTLLGHSGGAAVAARYAVEHPRRVRQLVLVAPPPPFGGFGEQVAREFRSRMDAAAWGRMTALEASLSDTDDPTEVCREIVATMLRHAYLADPSAMESMRSDFCASPPERLRTQPHRTAAFLRSLPADWRPWLRGLTVPTLVVHGDRDAIPIASSEGWVNSLLNGRLELIPAADHLPWLDRPRAFFGAVEAFLSRSH